MTDFPRINPAGKTDRELIEALLSGMEATHGCVDGFRAEQARRDQLAAEKRHQMSNTIASVQGSVRNLFKKVGSLETTQSMDSGRIDRLAKMFGAEKVEPGEKPPKGRGIGSMSPTKAVMAALGVVGGAVTLYKIAEPVTLAFLGWLHPALQVLDHAIKAAG